MKTTPFYSKNSFAEYCNIIRTELQLTQLSEKQAKAAMENYIRSVAVEKTIEKFRRD